MALFSHLSCIASVFYLYTGIYSLVLDRNKTLNRIFFVFSLFLSAWSFLHIYKFDANTAEQAYWIYQITSFAWTSFASFTLHFIVVFTKQKGFLSRWYSKVLIYLPAVVMTVANFFTPVLYECYTRTDNLWLPVIATGSIWTWFFVLFVVVIFTLDAIILVRRLGNSLTRKEKKQIILILSTGSFVFLLNMLNIVILPSIGVNILPDMTPILTIPLFVGILVAMTKYRLMKLTPTFAAEDIVGKVMELLIILDDSQNITWINEQAQRLLGYEMNALIGIPFTRLVLENDWLSSELVKASEEHYTESLVKLHYKTKEGKAIPMMVTLSPMRDTNHDIMGVLIVGQDMQLEEQLQSEYNRRIEAEAEIKRINIELSKSLSRKDSELKETAEKLQMETRERRNIRDISSKYSFIVNTSKEYMTLINRDYVYEAVNHAYCEAHHKSREEIVGHTVSEVWGRDIFETIIKRYMDRCFEGLEVSYTEWFVFGALGKRFLEVTYYPYKDTLGDYSHLAVVSRDITERKYIEERWNNYDRIINTVEETMALINRDFVFEAVNNAYCRTLAKTPEEIVGKSIREILGDEIFEHSIKSMMERCLNGESVVFERWSRFPQTGSRCIEGHFYPFLDNSGSITHVALIGYDITRFKIREDELTSQRERLEIMNAKLWKDLENNR